MQIQRASGAFMVSSRQPSARQEEELPFSLPLPPELAGADDEAASSLAEDEEFAAEEHAHRYAPSLSTQSLATHAFMHFHHARMTHTSSVLLLPACTDCCW